MLLNSVQACSPHAMRTPSRDAGQIRSVPACASAQPFATHQTLPVVVYSQLLWMAYSQGNRFPLAYSVHRPNPIFTQIFTASTGCMGTSIHLLLFIIPCSYESRGRDLPGHNGSGPSRHQALDDRKLQELAISELARKLASLNCHNCLRRSALIALALVVRISVPRQVSKRIFARLLAAGLFDTSLPTFQR